MNKLQFHFRIIEVNKMKNLRVQSEYNLKKITTRITNMKIGVGIQQRNAILDSVDRKTKNLVM